ncbi:hypothetical protein DOE62_08135 [Salmonella enterica subsp. enterica serovar Brandenburg]|nr:hypothetical protein DOE62_08135 [Salmonella enterica subsp. enterica serovar Brandenburg]
MVPFALLLGWGRWCARAGISRVTSGNCCSPPGLHPRAVGTLPWLLEDKIIAMTAVGMAMACWIAVLAVAEAVQRVSRGADFPSSRGWWRHLGLAVTITGIAFSQNYSVERTCGCGRATA